MPESMVIFTRTYDLLTWLIPKSMDFPRSQRFVVTKRLQDAALNFQEQILEANRLRGRARLDRLVLADAELDKVRLYLRPARDGATRPWPSLRARRRPGEYRTGPAPGHKTGSVLP